MSLELDHIYICFSRLEFDLIKDNYINEYGAVHQIHSSNEASWEGLYLYSQEGFYLEILKESDSCRVGQVGIAFTDRGDFPQFSTLKQEPGFKADTIKNQKGESWFEYLTIEVENDFSFYSWWMKYPESKKEERFNTHGKHKILKFKKVTLGLSSKGFTQRNEYSQICPTNLVEDNGFIELVESPIPWIKFDTI
jgi:hypothetical protein